MKFRGLCTFIVSNVSTTTSSKWTALLHICTAGTLNFTMYICLNLQVAICKLLLVPDAHQAMILRISSDRLLCWCLACNASSQTTKKHHLFRNRDSTKITHLKINNTWSLEHNESWNASGHWSCISETISQWSFELWIYREQQDQATHKNHDNQDRTYVKFVPWVTFSQAVYKKVDMKTNQLSLLFASPFDFNI